MASSHPLSASSLFCLKGWVAVVTGGGTGIGLMITQALASNGAKVYITGRRTDVLETTARVHGTAERLGSGGGAIVPLAMDVTSKESITNAVERISQQESHINVLVNNAGVWAGRPSAKPQDGPEAYGKAMFDEGIEDGWQRAFLTNSTAPYLVTAAFVPLLAKAQGSTTGKAGSVINISSSSGMITLSQNSQYSYNVSKAALNHLTRQMAYELRNENINIRVNAIAPGYFPSEMTAGPSDDNNQNTYEQEGFRQFMQSMGAKVTRMGSAEELASVVLTLATNDYITGAIIPVDGGFTL
ncbi:hypothetical protein JX265_009952 [Neoarthrinium moseri]|uniref:NAD(P)-binding protein n=1 Tax=Neoarthrinium moseri TaxID=1658444 RepID=A0A9Q0AL85_9PEZI|nr:hypothetical protein JX266_012321 [Neoarthrinium moseri]KAI1860553.1 hypothetical protein JX265_009952 [Neoarthrinium moseri]